MSMPSARAPRHSRHGPPALAAVNVTVGGREHVAEEGFQLLHDYRRISYRRVCYR
jgi:hypothetical protein